MLKVGLTGGIGSGKSTVAGIFEVLGVPVYYADREAKRLMNEDSGLKEAIRKAFGDNSYSNDKLDRKYLADTVFNNPKKLEQLNAIVHPATFHDVARWINKQTSPYVIKEAALIFESGSNKFLDYTIGVQAPEPLRISRTITRDAISYEEVLIRMQKQMPEDEKMRLCDFVIVNDEENAIIPQVLELHNKFMRSTYC